MKLQNKKTGEILDFNRITDVEFGHKILLQATEYHDKPIYIYNSLAELNAEWEDYEAPKEYWFINPEGEVISFIEADDSPEGLKASKQIGNYFGTKEEAEKSLEKLKAWKRLKDNGFKIKGWKFTPDMKQIQGNYVKIEAEIPQILINEKDIDLLFGGEE